jgi:hypothetical protein
MRGKAGHLTIGFSALKMGHLFQLYFSNELAGCQKSTLPEGDR